jgi:hypothetical protein
MFQGTGIIVISASPQSLEAAQAEGFHTLDAAAEAVASAKESEWESKHCISEPKCLPPGAAG